MKKALALLLAALMVFSMVACAAKEAAPAEEKPAAETPVTEDKTVENIKVEKEVTEAKEGETLNYKKDLVFGYHQANVSVGPQDSQSGMQKTMEFTQFNRLLSFDPEAKELVGDLAESWTVEENGKIWTFVLKKGVLFHNGEELKADDVVFTWERAVELGKVTQNWSDPPEKVEALDDYTVRFTLKNGNVDYGFQMTQATASILNRKACEEDPENGIGVGTNGWKVKEFVANDHTTFERFDDSFVYWDTGVNPTETITFKYIADQNARMLGVQAGDLDIGFIANNAEFYNYQKDASLEPVICASWSLDYVGMNPSCEYFQDENVRKAIAYAINKDEALEIINNGFGLTCKSFWCPDAVGYTENFSENYEYNVEKAKEYLAKSAYPNGFTVKLTTINAYSLYAETIQAQLAAIGINCEVELTDSPGMNDAGANGTLQLFIWNTTMAPYGDFLRQTITSGGTANYAHFSNPKIDELMAAGSAEVDNAKRAEIYEQVQEELNSDCYLVPLFFGYLSALTRANVEGYTLLSTGYYLNNTRAIVE